MANTSDIEVGAKKLFLFFFFFQRRISK